MATLSPASTAGRARVAPLPTLGRPVVEYADVDPDPQESRVAAGEGIWRDGPDDRREWSDGRLELSVWCRPACVPVDGDRIVIRARARSALRLRRCTVELRMAAVEPPSVLTPQLRWRRGVRSLALGSSAALVVRWRGPDGRGHELRTIDRTMPAQVAWRDGTLVVSLVLDAAAMHPRWRFDGGTRSRAAPRWEAGAEIGVALLFRSVPDEAPEACPAVASRLPHGAEGAFTITDHCDFDTVDRLRLFLHGQGGRRGWLGRGLRLTKGVFAVPSAAEGERSGHERREAPAPTLRDGAYLALVHRLHDDASEIAPHALSERGTLEPRAFHDALRHLARTFAPRTWIDHGLTIRYCYTMGGADDPRYALVRTLAEHGFEALWSYHDTPVDAAASLDMLAPPRSDLGASTRRAAAHAARGRLLVSAYYARSALLSRLQGRAADVAGRSFSLARDTYLSARSGTLRTVAASVRRAAVGIALAASGARTGAVVPHVRRELIECAPIAYAERGLPLADAAPGELVLFASQEVQHVTDAYTPQSLRALAEERGVHVGHCYLLNRLPYLAGLFAPGDGERLADGWLDALDALEALVEEGRLWNPAMGELAAWLRDAQRVSLFPDGASAVLVRHSLPIVMRHYTVLLPASAVAESVTWGGGPPAGSRSWGDWLAVWGEVPPGGVRVAWRASTGC